MTESTKHTTTQFGQVAHFENKREHQHTTRFIMQKRTETIKITEKEIDKDAFFGYKTVNYADRRVREAYLWINKMLH